MAPSLFRLAKSPVQIGLSTFLENIARSSRYLERKVRGLRNMFIYLSPKSYFRVFSQDD